jgi:hypothetical protein
VADTVKVSTRAKLVEDVFLRYLESRRPFSLELGRCALKGWPDKGLLVRNTTRVQMLFFDQLSTRLARLMLHNGSDDAIWSNYTTTSKVHERLQTDWSGYEEQALRARDSTYTEMQREPIELQAVADPDALFEPFKMARRDPELIAAAWKQNDATISLDGELAI